MMEILLTEMAGLLNSDGVNYSVSLHVYSGVTDVGSSVDDIVRGLIGHDVTLNGVRDVNSAEVIETMQQSLNYAGDGSAAPRGSVLESIEFSRLLKSIRDSVMQLSHAAHEIKTFEFIEGHPGYPVFWDFAYLFLGKDKNVLLVGLSSD